MLGGFNRLGTQIQHFTAKILSEDVMDKYDDVSLVREYMALGHYIVDCSPLTSLKTTSTTYIGLASTPMPPTLDINKSSLTDALGRTPPSAS